MAMLRARWSLGSDGGTDRRTRKRRSTTGRFGSRSEALQRAPIVTLAPARTQACGDPTQRSSSGVRGDASTAARRPARLPTGGVDHHVRLANHTAERAKTLLRVDAGAPGAHQDQQNCADGPPRVHGMPAEPFAGPLSGPGAPGERLRVACTPTVALTRQDADCGRVPTVPFQAPWGCPAGCEWGTPRSGGRERRQGRPRGPLGLVFGARTGPLGGDAGQKTGERHPAPRPVMARLGRPWSASVSSEPG